MSIHWTERDPTSPEALSRHSAVSLPIRRRPMTAISVTTEIGGRTINA